MFTFYGVSVVLYVIHFSYTNFGTGEENNVRAKISITGLTYVFNSYTQLNKNDFYINIHAVYTR